MAIVRGEDADAARLMAPGVEGIDRMGGGSREQKDIFRDEATCPSDAPEVMAARNALDVVPR
jgi:hypothetical protein